MPANLIKITALKKQTKVKTACMARLPGIVRPSSNTLQPDMPAAWNEKRFCKNAAFCIPKGGILACNTWPFMKQKAMYCIISYKQLFVISIQPLR